MDYMIISASEWRLPVQDLPRHLLARWPATRLRPIQNPESTQCLDFEVPMAHAELRGALDREGRYVSFVGDIRDVAEFALWCRTLAPPSAPLIFGDTSAPEGLYLKPETTLSDIFRLYDYTPPRPGWMNYSLVARPSWPLSPEEFAQRLRQRWPTAHVELLPAANPHRSVEFRLPMAHAEVTGALKRVVSSPDFTGDLRDCAEFALRCRSVVPAEELVLICERGNLSITPRTTVQEILHALQPPATP